MSELIEYKDAPLPSVYETAKTALATCTKVDECKEWADKAIALSSYARQANDDELLNMSNRIKARAVDRMGALFKQIEPGTGANSAVAGRQAMADEAGVSIGQRKQAQSVASLPREEFEALVESENPPTITALADMARRGSSNPKAMKASTKLLGALKSLAQFCEENDTEEILGVLAEHERAAVLEHSQVTIEWLTKLAREI